MYFFLGNLLDTCSAPFLFESLTKCVLLQGMCSSLAHFFFKLLSNRTSFCDIPFYFTNDDDLSTFSP